MTDKLLHCPFCGGEAHYDRGRMTGISAVVCPCSSHVFYGAEKSREATIAAWNTRAERTCEVSIGDGDSAGWWVCQACGTLFDMVGALAGMGKKKPNYCPECGARVVS